jgi:hypothetical protein
MMESDLIELMPQLDAFHKRFLYGNIPLSRISGRLAVRFGGCMTTFSP